MALYGISSLHFQICWWVLMSQVQLCYSGTQMYMHVLAVHYKRTTVAFQFFLQFSYLEHCLWPGFRSMHLLISPTTYCLLIWLEVPSALTWDSVLHSQAEASLEVWVSHLSLPLSLSLSSLFFRSADVHCSTVLIVVQYYHWWLYLIQW